MGSTFNIVKTSYFQILFYFKTQLFFFLAALRVGHWLVVKMVVFYLKKKKNVIFCSLTRLCPELTPYVATGIPDISGFKTFLTYIYDKCKENELKFYKTCACRKSRQIKKPHMSLEFLQVHIPSVFNYLL